MFHLTTRYLHPFLNAVHREVVWFGSTTVVRAIAVSMVVQVNQTIVDERRRSQSPALALFCPFSETFLDKNLFLKVTVRPNTDRLFYCIITRMMIVVGLLLNRGCQNMRTSHT